LLCCIFRHAVYLICCTGCGCVYCGQTKDFRHRVNDHLRTAKRTSKVVTDELESANSTTMSSGQYNELMVKYSLNNWKCKYFYLFSLDFHYITLILFILYYYYFRLKYPNNVYLFSLFQCIHISTQLLVLTTI